MKKFTEVLVIIALVLAGFTWPFFADAQVIPSIPYNLTNGSVADATQVMGNFNTIVTDVNANAAAGGVNTNITSLTGLTTPLAATYGGTVVYTGGTTGGSANAQTLATTVPSNFALTAGNIVTGLAGFTNTGATTLSVNSGTATAVRKQTPSGLTALTGGEIVLGQALLFYYDGTYFELVNNTSGITNAQLAPMANLTVKGNISGASATPSDLTSAQVLSLISAPSANNAALTGVPTAPTAAVSTNTTQLATTAFVLSEVPTQGNAVTQNPLTANTAVSGAHGLSAQPNGMIAYFQCLSGELGYSAGDRVYISTAYSDTVANITFFADATNAGFSTDPTSGNIYMNAKGGGSKAAITYTKWEVVMIPLLYH